MSDGKGPEFLCPLELEYIDGHNWKLTAAFDYMSDVLGRVVDIPSSFVTDFASIPRALWSFLPPTGTYGKAAVVHDWLYRTPGQASRSQADNVLMEAMKVLGVGAFTRRIIYAGVRIGGKGAYKGGCDQDVPVDASGHVLKS